MARFFLPGDAVIEILSRLPVKSLVRFRCVSKPWNSLISSNSFIAQHLLNQTTQDRTECFLLQRGSLRAGDLTISLISTGEPLDEVVNLDLPPEPNLERVKIVGSCNGLVCLSMSHDWSVYSLWNPATRDFRTLPASPFCIRSGNSYMFVILRFGFHSENSDYKLLRIGYHSASIHKACSFLVDIYTTSRNSWRKVECDLQCGISFYDSPVVFKGAFHWIVNQLRNIGPNFIVSFDIGSETFFQLPAPDYGEFNGPFGKLDVVKGFLAVIVCFGREDDMNYIHVWVMHDYGVDGYWTKQFCVGPVWGLSIPIGIWKNCELLLHSPEISTRYSSYNLCTNELSFPSFGGEDFYQIHRYVESLVRTHIE